MADGELRKNGVKPWKFVLFLFGLYDRNTRYENYEQRGGVERYRRKENFSIKRVEVREKR